MMKAPKFYMNNYIKEELLEALDAQDVCVSYSGDYHTDVLSQVHNSCELLFVEEGEADYEVNGQTYHVNKNTVLIIGATDHHRFTFTKVPYIRYGLTLMPAFLRTLPIVNGYMNLYQTQTLEGHKKLTNVDDAVFQRLIQVLWNLREEMEDGEGGHGNMVYALILELTLLLKRLLHLENQENNGSYKAMNEIKNYIDQHYQEDLSLSALSRQFYLQPNTISKNFRSVWGRNINQYIHSVRITQAVHLLENTDMSITEISLTVGYENINTFLRQFREKMEVSPLQYKKRKNEWRE